MNKIFAVTISLSFLLLLYQQLYAQKDKKQSEKRNKQTDQIIINNPEEYAIQEQIFKMGLKYGDVDLAKSALAKMIVLNPGNTSLKDSLAMLYFKAGQYVQCILVSREVIENNPNDTAKDLFSEALKIFPDFELAKDNLKLLESKVQKN